MKGALLNRRTWLGLVLAAATTTAMAGEIPDRPEKLPVKPLKYDAPDPANHRVVLKSGPVAYLVPDRELPLVNISVLVRTGDYLNPQGKEGLAGLVGYLLTKSGIPAKSAEELDERLAFLAANLNSNVGEAQGAVTLNLLSKDLEEGLQILRDVLTAPKFQENKIALRKQQILQAMQQRNDDSAAIEQRERRFLAYGENFFLNRHATGDSIASITAEDLKAFHQKWFHPDNFIVAVNGDFDRAEMTAKLEKLFANWPFKGEKPAPVPSEVTMAKPGIYLVDKDVNQGRVSILLPGVYRDNPDYLPILVMNDILGGGGFTSRIVNRVRSDEGLAYSAGSGFPGGVYYRSAFVAAFQSKSRTVPYAISLVLEELQKMGAAPVTEEELVTSKSSFVDTFPENFSTAAQVAGTFAGDELTGRYAKQPDFWKTFRTKVNAVTAEDVKRVATKYLTADKVTILVVGQKEEILKGHPNHPVKLTDLSKGPLTDVPLRDPLTMKPLVK
jgi:zinc protease